MRRPRFLVFAYACEPERGSEPEAGWIWSRMLARIGEAWVITRSNNRDAIERYVSEIPEGENLRFIYVDLPSWARFWKRRNKGARLYYLLWQVAALSRARELGRQVDIDIVWHLTWANAWLGSLAPLLPRSFAYGPVGGGASMDWRLLPVVGVRGALYELGRSLARTAARHLNPFARLAWRRARLILAQNPETLAWLPARHRSKAVVFSHAVIDEATASPTRIRDRHTATALYAGRLIPWKGIVLAIRALALLPDWRLVIVGKGPDERRLKRLTRRLGVDQRVEFLGYVPRTALRSLMHRADVFIFPSLHDEGPFAVAEALAEGLPVVCIARGGPPVIGGDGIVATTVLGTAAELATAMLNASGTEPRPFPDMESRTQRLREILAKRFPSLEQSKSESSSSGLTLGESEVLSD